MTAEAIEGAILQITAEKDEMCTEEKAEAMAEDVGVKLGVDLGVNGLDALVQVEDDAVEDEADREAKWLVSLSFCGTDFE